MRTILLLPVFSVTLLAQPGGPPGGQGDGIWRRNAFWGEAQTMDACEGHQPQTGQYHHHMNPICLRAQVDDNAELVATRRTGADYREKAAPWKHSPILGWAWDGYPIYGPYGYGNPNDATSPVTRLRPGFRLRSIAARTSLPAWTLPTHPGVGETLTALQYGPPINAEFPLGRYIEDYEYAAGIGDLDQYNGRFAVTPEYPQGTYAYHVTIDGNGVPAFPYIMAGQFYGTARGGNVQTIPTSATVYFQNGQMAGNPQTAPLLTSWLTKHSTANAQVVSSFNPSAGPQTTWPTGNLWGTRTSGGASSPVLAGPQAIYYTDSEAYMTGFGMGTYVMGPWFDPGQTGGDFGNYPSRQNYQMQVPRNPEAAQTRTATGLGVQGLWINGVAVYNFLDGASYGNARGADAGGGIVTPAMQVFSPISWERGPVSPGSLLAAYSLFGAALADRTEAAPGAAWPATLGGAAITVQDAAGATRGAGIGYASPATLYFRLPENTALGNATLTVSVGSRNYRSNINVQATYPHLAIANAEYAASGQVVHVRGGQQVVEAASQPISLEGDSETYLVLYGSGRGAETAAAATIAGIAAEVTYAGPMPSFSGADQYNVRIPGELAGRGAVDVVVTVAGRPSNAVRVKFQ
ncbi:MAG: YHYH protein [Acidobacteria bacterium]|nr:YHYH protein [Acidobacteriota bacterium]